MRRRAFPGSGPEIDQRYLRAGHWLKATIFESDSSRNWCSKNGVPVVKAQGEGIGSTGEFVVPTELAQVIYDIREQYGAFRRTARIQPMASSNMIAPRRPGGTGAFFMTENNAGTETTPTIDAVQLTARKIGSLIRLSSEIAEDSFPDIVDFVANEIAYAFASKEDDCAFSGDGTSTYGGMYGVQTLFLDGNHNKGKVTAATGHNTFGGTTTAIDLNDLGNVMGAVRASALPTAAWFISEVGFGAAFCRLAGGYIDSHVINGVVTPFFLGFPVILTAKMPTITTTLTGKVMLAFGSMYAAGVLGQRRGITLARSPDRYLDQDQIAILGTQRFDAVLHDCGDNTNFGSLAALVAP